MGVPTEGVDYTVFTAYGAYTSSLDMARRSLDVNGVPGALRQIYGILWNLELEKGGARPVLRVCTIPREHSVGNFLGEQFKEKRREKRR